MRTLLLLAFATLLGLVSCTDKKQHLVANVPITYTFNVPGTGSITKAQTFTLPSPVAERLTLDRCNLYLSNLVFVKADGSTWAEQNSYHLLSMPAQGASPSSTFTVKVPTGEYTSIRYAFGVDSASNTSLDKKGDLDPANGMAWDWNTGYRFLVMEGHVSAGGGQDSALVWHIGNNDNYHTGELTFPQSLKISGSGDGFNLSVNLYKAFYGYYTLPPYQNPNTMANLDAMSKAATNMVGVFEIVQP